MISLRFMRHLLVKLTDYWKIPHGGCLEVALPTTELTVISRAPTKIGGELMPKTTRNTMSATFGYDLHI